MCREVKSLKLAYRLRIESYKIYIDSYIIERVNAKGY